jgi:hypothetical protein
MTHGLAGLMEEVATVARPELADDLWRLVYTRNHVDIDRARPYVDRDHAGILVYAKPLDRKRTLAIVETGDRLVGATGSFGPLPRLGSAVRLTAGGGVITSWRLIVDDAFPLALDVHFDRAPSGAADRRWIVGMRHALGAIRAAEAVRRDGIAARRRTLPKFADVPTCEEVVRERIDALRHEVERETAYTAAENDELDAARYARFSGTYFEQRRGHEREAAIVRTRQLRFDARMRAALDAFRRELPQLHQRWRAMQSANEATRATLLRLEGAYAESRARMRASFTASRWLDALAGAPFVVTGFDAPPPDLDDPVRANDVLRAVALLVRALPRTGARIAV